MYSNVLVVISWMFLIAAFMSSTLILIDIFARGYRQKMGIMNWVWPVTTLYSGPLGLYFYYRFGRQSSQKWEEINGKGGYSQSVSIAIGVSHCGAGCTVGDIIGASSVFILGLQLAGLALWPEYIVDFSLALILGIVFQYYSITPMRGLGFKDGLIAAIKADTLSLVAFEVGLFGWMALMQLVFYPVHHIHPDTPVYWFLMQIGMVLGFATAYPINAWLIKRGIKEPM